jgi:tol-pal system protein YbgF
LARPPRGGLPFKAMLGRVSRLSFAFGLSIAGAFGCSHTETSADKHFAEMREQVTRMQADHDKIDQRLGALEVAAADEKTPQAGPSGQPGQAGQPGPAGGAPVRSVQLGGAGDAEPADPNDPSARPDIRVTGQPGAISPRPRAGKSRGRSDDQDLPTVRADAPRPSALDPDAKKAYEAALALVQGKQYDKGLEGLNAFLVRWPDHPYAENAMYWRGEAYYAQGEYLRAAEQFDAVVARFGSGNKAPDAMLKLGMCHDRLGSTQRAREYWDRLKNEYPRSDAAKRIPNGGRDASPKGPKEYR